jgi:enamine deaminase RidA (YjgF/YER057c/UK114 family)
VTITHLNPEGLHRNPAFSHAISVAGPAALVFVGGQNGVDADGNVVSDDAATQAKQALLNVERALRVAGGSIADIVKWTIAVTDRAALGAAFAAFQETWGQRPNPPTITVQIVAGLANPHFMVEIDAIAAL